MKIYVKESDFPFLYADKQIIDLNNRKNVYELKFKIKLFNEGDSLIIRSVTNKAFNNINLMNHCTVKEKELICNIDKNDIEGHILSNKETFQAISFGKGYGIIYHNLISEVIIEYNGNKENINI